MIIHSEIKISAVKAEVHRIFNSYTIFSSIKGKVP